MNSICKAKSINNNTITGYYVNIKGTSYIIPEDTESVDLIPIDETTLCRYTGLNDRFDNRIFEHDLVIAGKYKSECINFNERDRDDYEPKSRVYREYAGVLKVYDGGIYWAVEPFEDLYDCFIEDCADFLAALNEEYFIENLGNVEDATSKAYEFWYNVKDKRIYVD